MSMLVHNWVMNTDRRARANDLLVLLAVADEADDDGYAYPSFRTLAAKARIDKGTVPDVVRRLERSGHLLVNRPERQGRGHYNRYIVVMDRHVGELRDRYGWVPSLPVDQGSDTDSEPVDTTGTAPAEGGRNATLSDPEKVAEGWRKGGEKVAPDPYCPRPLTQDPTSTADLANGPAPGCVDLTVVDNRIDMVRRRLASLAPHLSVVRWDLTAQQVRELRVHMAAWPTDADAADEWARASIDSVQHHGEIPRSARAWKALWLQLDPPADVAGGVMCTDHALGDLAVPKRVCAVCRYDLVTAS
ncbi:MAG TPA: helix-turn-helix domain-containing protein [Mycobacteriales bacterium]|nr:helix-turn-helix domain-containing protein [Mycobacteriales bacterium]